METRASTVDVHLREELDELAATLCKALIDPKRLAVLYALRDRPHTVTELCDMLDSPQSNTSQHLAVLRDRDLVDTERRGSNVTYSLRHPKVLDAIDLLREVMTDEHDRRHLVRRRRTTGRKP